MSFHPTCIICHTPKPLADPTAVDNSRWGPCESAVCEELRSSETEIGPLFSIRQLQDQNAQGMTKYELEREIVADAARDGREIERA